MSNVGLGNRLLLSKIVGHNFQSAIVLNHSADRPNHPLLAMLVADKHVWAVQ